jgi:probable HAF family extracellular repeat protein
MPSTARFDAIAASRQVAIAALRLPPDLIEVGGGRVRAFLFDRGDYTIIDVPGAGNASAVDINNRRQIVGAYRDSDGMTRGYFLDDGELTNVEVPGALVTMPLGINNKGHVVGFYIDADLSDALVAHGFLYKNGTYTRIDHPLAFTGTSSFDVSDNGQIVGFYDRAATRAMEAGSAGGQSLGPAALEMWGPGSEPAHPG